jgi:siroheme synthase-like protein
MGNHKFNFLPVSVNISGKRILIIGGGNVGFHKASVLSRFTDRATVISPKFHEGFGNLSFELIEKEYQKTDLTGAFLVYICTGNPVLNEQIKRDAEELGIQASVCDNPQLCDFISPAIYKEDNVTIAVSTNAGNVYQAIDIRNQIQDLASQGLLVIDC